MSSARFKNMFIEYFRQEADRRRALAAGRYYMFCFFGISIQGIAINVMYEYLLIFTLSAESKKKRRPRDDEDGDDGNDAASGRKYVNGM